MYDLNQRGAGMLPSRTTNRTERQETKSKNLFVNSLLIIENLIIDTSDIKYKFGTLFSIFDHFQDFTNRLASLADTECQEEIDLLIK